MFQTSGTFRASIFWRQTHVMSGTVASNPRVPTRRLAVKASRTDLTWPGEQRHDPCFLNGHVRCIYTCVCVYIYMEYSLLYMGWKMGFTWIVNHFPNGMHIQVRCWDLHTCWFIKAAHLDCSLEAANYGFKNIIPCCFNMYYTMDLKQHHGLSMLYACCYPSYTICINHYKPSPCCSSDPVGNSSAVKHHDGSFSVRRPGEPPREKSWYHHWHQIMVSG